MFGCTIDTAEPLTLAPVVPLILFLCAPPLMVTFAYALAVVPVVVSLALEEAGEVVTAGTFPFKVIPCEWPLSVAVMLGVVLPVVPLKVCVCEGKFEVERVTVFAPPVS